MVAIRRQGSLAVSSESVSFDHRGGVLVFTPPKSLEDLSEDVTKTVAAMLDQHLEALPEPSVVVDLTGIEYFGSNFISLLLQIWGRVRMRQGTMVIAGASHGARELLRLTNLDTLFALYDQLDDALAALTVD